MGKSDDLLLAQKKPEEKIHDGEGKAHEDRSMALVYLKTDPEFNGLRSEPCFTDLLGG